MTRLAATVKAVVTVLEEEFIWKHADGDVNEHDIYEIYQRCRREKNGLQK